MVATSKICSVRDKDLPHCLTLLWCQFVCAIRFVTDHLLPTPSLLPPSLPPLSCFSAFLSSLPMALSFLSLLFLSLLSHFISLSLSSLISSPLFKIVSGVRELYQSAREGNSDFCCFEDNDIIIQSSVFDEVDGDPVAAARAVFVRK